MRMPATISPTTRGHADSLGDLGGDLGGDEDDEDVAEDLGYVHAAASDQSDARPKDRAGNPTAGVGHAGPSARSEVDEDQSVDSLVGRADRRRAW